MITASSSAHSDLIVAAAQAGKAIFCEKPASMTLAEADRALAAKGDLEAFLRQDMDEAADFPSTVARLRALGAA